MQKLFVGLLLFSSFALADDFTVQKFGQWTVRCLPGTAKECAAAIGGKHSGLAGVWVKMGLYVSKGEKKETLLMVRTPSVPYDRKSFPLHIDESQVGLISPECDENYCQAEVRLRESDVEKLKTGKNLIVSFRLPPTNDGVALFISLEGAAEALQFLEE